MNSRKALKIIFVLCGQSFILQFPSPRPHLTGTQLHDKQGEGFSHSAPLVRELMLFDVLSMRLSKEQY